MKKQESEFERCLKNGKKGEDIVLKYLIDNYNDYYFEYVGDDKKYQDIDIDLLMKKDNEEITIEIKTDYTDYNNFFCELISCEFFNTPGCWKKTKSDYIFYYFVKKKKLYILDTNQAKDIAFNGNWKEGRASEYVNGFKKNSVGALVPIPEMVKLIDYKNYKFKKEVKI